MAKYSNTAKVNPSSPIIYMKIGDTIITTANTPRHSQYLISLSLTESAMDTYSDIVFTLYDESALVVEYELKRGYNDILYKFGMDETSMSSERHCHVKDYDIEFITGGIMLTLECENGVLNVTGNQAMDEKAKEYKGKISDIVRQIAKEEGYIEGNIVDTNDTDGTYTSSGYSAIDFIKNVLVPRAVSTKGESGYTFYTKDKDGKSAFYFHPILEDSTDDVTTYEYMIGEEHENIISFKPEYKGLLYALVNPEGTSSVGSAPDMNSSVTDSSTITNQDTSNTTFSTSLSSAVSNYSRTPRAPSSLIGTKIYAKNKQCKVYNKYDSKKGKVVQTLISNQWARIVSETAAWYQVVTNTNKQGWVRKVDCTIWEPTIKPYNPSDADYKDDHKYNNSAQNHNTENNGLTTTPTDNYMTETNSSPSTNNAVVHNIGLLAPSVDELSNVLIKPYNSNSTYKRYVGSSSYNPEELGRIAEYMFKMASVLMPTAQLELRGNAIIDTQSLVLIVVLTKDKLFHHSSGLYQVVEVAHNIEMGTFTTTLNLIKRAMSIDDDGKITLLDVSEGIMSNSMMSDSSSQGTGTPDNSSNDGTENISGNVVNSASSSTIKTYAQKYVGLPYFWGGSGPNQKGYDCSGFCSEMLYDIVYTRIGTTAQFINTGQVIPWDKSQIRPGDCMVYRQNGAGHVVMVVDQNTIVHAPHTGDVIKYADLDYWWNYMQKKNGKVMRYIGIDTYKR